jgi:hypothetical protein
MRLKRFIFGTGKRRNGGRPERSFGKSSECEINL